MMNAFSEGLELADRSGLNPQTLLDVLVRQLTADSSHIPLVLHLLFHFFLYQDLAAIANPMFKMKGPPMLQNNYTPAFPLKHQQKDMRLALALGDENAISMPVAAAANEVRHSSPQ